MTTVERACVARVRLLVLGRVAQGGGCVTWLQAERALAPIAGRPEDVPWSSPEWLAVPTAAAAAAAATCSPASFAGSSDAKFDGRRRGDAVVKGPQTDR
jgi:hypothetical protein